MSASHKDLEAKIVILGSSNVGKTTLLQAYLNDGSSAQQHPVPTVGASFQTKRIISPPDAPGTTLRLQIWDTAGQERFRSISRLYYRGADAALLCYDVTDERSFVDMGRWMEELRANCGPETTVHVVGTKADIVAADPASRQVPFERCIQYVAEHLQVQHGLSSSVSNTPGAGRRITIAASPPNRNANRHSGFWDYSDASWDCCHEISARDGEGVDEVFRVVTRKLIEQRLRKDRAREALETPGFSDSGAGNSGGYFDHHHHHHGDGGLDGRGSFRLGNALDKRRSWLGAFGSHPVTPGTPAVWGSNAAGDADDGATKGGRCC